MEPQDNSKRNQEEVDLTHFFRWVGSGLNRFGNNIIYIIATLRNIFFGNLIFFGGIIVVGLILGAVYSEFLKKKFYKSTMVLSCDYLNSQILGNTISKLNQLCQEPDRSGLIDVLKIDQRTAKNIQNFEFKAFVSENDIVEMEVLKTQLNSLVGDKKELVDQIIRKLTIDNKNAYQISIMVYQPDIVKNLEKSLVNYFKTNLYLSKRIEIHRRNLEMRKQKLIDESKKLDSLKNVFFESYQNLGKASRGSGNVILGDEKLANPLDVFKQDLELNEQLLEIEKQLYVNPDFEVVDGFTTFKQPESASLFKILAIAFMLSILTGYLIIGAWKFNAMLSKIDTKSK
jgi:hypothetical protein